MVEPRVTGGLDTTTIIVAVLALVVILALAARWDGRNKRAKGDSIALCSPFLFSDGVRVFAGFLGNASLEEKGNNSLERHK